MARPNRVGFDYYNFDTGFLKDIKVRKIMRAIGPESIAVLIDLLGYIYSDHGYYMIWDDDAPFIIADDTETTEELVKSVVAKSIEVGFFSRQMFNQFSILTSHGIQKRVKRMARKRSDFNIREPYLLLNLSEETMVSAPETQVNVPKTRVKGAESTQREIEREREKEIEIESKADGRNQKKPQEPGVKSDQNAREKFTLDIWIPYPKSRAFEDSFEEYQQARMTGTTHEEIVTGVQRYSDYIKIHHTTDRYTKALNNWLSSKGWLDDLDMTPEKVTSKPDAGANNSSFSDDDLPF